MRMLIGEPPDGGGMMSRLILVGKSDLVGMRGGILVEEWFAQSWAGMMFAVVRMRSGCGASANSAILSLSSMFCTFTRLPGRRKRYFGVPYQLFPRGKFEMQAKI